MFRALRYLEKLSTIIRFPGERHDLSRSGKPAHRVERLRRQAPAMRLVSTVIVLVLTSALHQPTSPWHQDAKSHFALGRDHCEGEFGAAPLSSEIGLTRDAGAERRVHRSSSDARSATTPGSSRRNCAHFRGVAARQILRLTLYCALTRMFPGRFSDYLRPAARYAIQNAERAVRELRQSHNSEFDRLPTSGQPAVPKRPDHGWNRGAN